jgi:hypothetical protein
MSREQPPETHGLRAQVRADQVGARAGRVPLVEHEVDDGQHGLQAGRELGRGRHAVGDARIADLALGAHQPLRHRRLGHQERARDLRRGQPAQQAQRQGHLRAAPQRGVAAREDEPQAVVLQRPLLGLVLARMQQHGLRVPVGPRRLAAQPVDRPVACGGDDPARRAGRHPVGRPALHGRGEGVGHRLLGHVEVAEHAHQDRDRPAVLRAEHALDLEGVRAVQAVSTPPGPGRGGPRPAA